MNRRTFFAFLTLIALTLAGCSRGTAPPASASQEDPERAAVRAALTKYLSERGTLNMDAMQMDIKDVKFTGDRADVQVQFRVKDAQDAGMDMDYVLQREAGVWVVKTSASPGMQTHPPVGGTTGGASGELPASHPPLTPPKKQ